MYYKQDRLHFHQRFLSHSTTPGGLVLPIAATAPLLSIPIVFWLEGDRPTRRSIVGAVIAVAGCIALTLNR